MNTNCKVMALPVLSWLQYDNAPLGEVLRCTKMWKNATAFVSGNKIAARPNLRICSQHKNWEHWLIFYLAFFYMEKSEQIFKCETSSPFDSTSTISLTNPQGTIWMTFLCNFLSFLCRRLKHNLIIEKKHQQKQEKFVAEQNLNTNSGREAEDSEDVEVMWRPFRVLGFLYEANKNVALRILAID